MSHHMIGFEEIQSDLGTETTTNDCLCKTGHTSRKHLASGTVNRVNLVFRCVGGTSLSGFLGGIITYTIRGAA